MPQAKKLITTKPAIQAPSQSGTAKLASFEDLEGDVHDLHRISQLVVRAIEDLGQGSRRLLRSQPVASGAATESV
jgi:hypothetical protein